MNPFDDDMPARHDDTPGFESLSGGDEIETLLRGRARPGPDAGFRERVVGAMEEAAEERRLMLAGQARPTPVADPRPRLLPEMVAAIAAAIVVCVVPWGSGRRTVVGPTETAAVPAETTPWPVDEPADVHHALALLDARRDLFAALAGAERQHAEF